MYNLLMSFSAIGENGEFVNGIDDDQHQTEQNVQSDL